MARDDFQPDGGAADLDTFDSPAPVQDVAEAGPSGTDVVKPIETQNAPKDQGEDLTIDSFDNPVDYAELEKAAKSTESKEAKPKDEKEEVEDSQTGQVGKTDKKEEEEPEKEAKAEGEEEPAAEEQEPSEEGEKVKFIRARRGDDKVEVPEDATFRLSVDGKKESVSLRELMNNYSGRVAYDKKFSELDVERKSLQGERDQYLDEKTRVLEHLANVVEIVRGENSSPEDAVAYILDLTGEDSYSYKKAFFEQMSQEFEDYSDMDEVERENFWLKKKNDYLEKTRESSYQRQSVQQQSAEWEAKVDQMREAQGVSEDDFVSAYEDLVNQGVDPSAITPQQVIKYHQVLPHVAKAEELVGPYQDMIDENSLEEVVTSVTNALMGGISETDIAEELKSEYGEDEDEIVRVLNKKVPGEDLGKSQRKTARHDPYAKLDSDAEIETFDDYSEY